jgi:hypothetical protein
MNDTTQSRLLVLDQKSFPPLQNMMLKGSFEGYAELRAKSDAKATEAKL